MSVTAATVQTNATSDESTELRELTFAIGDTNALYFDFSDESPLNGLSVSGDDVTGSAFKANGVDNLGKGANMKGAALPEDGPFDAGVKFGSQGKAEDDIQETSFTLSHEDFDLILEDICEMDFGVRITSVGEEDDAREDSLKLTGIAPDEQDIVILEQPDGPDQPDELDQPDQPDEPENPQGPLTPDAAQPESDAAPDAASDAAAFLLGMDDTTMTEGAEMAAHDEIIPLLPDDAPGKSHWAHSEHARGPHHHDFEVDFAF